MGDPIKNNTDLASEYVLALEATKDSYIIKDQSDKQDKKTSIQAMEAMRASFQNFSNSANGFNELISADTRHLIDIYEKIDELDNTESGNFNLYDH